MSVYPDHYGTAGRPKHTLQLTLALGLVGGIVATLAIPTLQTLADHIQAFALFFAGVAICPLTWLLAMGLNAAIYRLWHK